MIMSGFYDPNIFLVLPQKCLFQETIEMNYKQRFTKVFTVVMLVIAKSKKAFTYPIPKLSLNKSNISI